jgi:hypothetical protein
MLYSSSTFDSLIIKEARVIQLRFGVLFIALALLLGGAAPIQAAEVNSEPPNLTDVTSMRAQLLVSFNGRPLEVCHQEYIGTNRFHEVCHQLATVTEQAIPEPDFPWTAGTVREFVYYEGTSYTRLNDETTWTAEADPEFDPNASSSINEAFFTWSPEAVLTRIGSATISDKQTTHYQYWTTDKAYNKEHHGTVVYDQFVSGDGLVLHDEVNHYGDFPGLGAGRLSTIWTYTDHNSSAIGIAPPPANLVKAGQP